uniref:FAD-dependent oxidoreductase n=1 Tax=Paractinoplanes polyasparticus TaxID=2856853 RepID=UPI0027E04823|nr:FAD-dependent oxidoreductase [Actinoplanes polyasparticus]
MPSPSCWSIRGPSSRTVSRWPGCPRRRSSDADQGLSPARAYARRMDVAVAGAGPAGLFCAVALARRGHRVTVVDGRELARGASGRRAGPHAPPGTTATRPASTRR